MTDGSLLGNDFGFDLEGARAMLRHCRFGGLAVVRLDGMFQTPCDVVPLPDAVEHFAMPEAESWQDFFEACHKNAEAYLDRWASRAGFRVALTVMTREEWRPFR